MVVKWLHNRPNRGHYRFEGDEDEESHIACEQPFTVLWCVTTEEHVIDVFIIYSTSSKGQAIRLSPLVVT